MLIKLKFKRNDIETMQFGSMLLLSPFAKVLAWVLGAGLLASLGMNGWQAWKMKDLEITNLKLLGDVQHIVGQLDGCRNTIKDTNEQITDVQVQAEKDKEILNSTIEDLRIITDMQNVQIERLKGMAPPKTCAESAAWLDQNLELFKGDNDETN